MKSFCRCVAPSSRHGLKETMMTRYRVQWEIDIDADSPADAAVKARRLCVNQEPECRFTVAVFAIASESGGIDDGPVFERIAELEVQADPSHPLYRVVAVFGDGTARAKITIRNICADDRERVREAVRLAMEFWPNAHLGDNSRREDMNSAFRMIRSYVAAGQSVAAAAGTLENDAYRHENM
jgi:hypothetical protein